MNIFSRRRNSLNPSPIQATSLDLDGVLESLALLLLASDGLGTHDTTTPVAAAVLVLVGVALLDSREELSQLGLVLLADLGQGEDGRGLTS